MNYGDCPYDCGGTLMFAVPENTPAYLRTVCPTCNGKIIYRLSRVDPRVYIEEDFDTTLKKVQER